MKVKELRLPYTDVEVHIYKKNCKKLSCFSMITRSQLIANFGEYNVISADIYHKDKYSIILMEEVD